MFFKRINEIQLQISFRARATTVLDHDNSIIKRIFIDKQSLKGLQVYKKI